ncbi:hypothetical protein P2G88_06560 [Aliiglaciecola sp. CAU 1673]|uniref:hypothetical protein n=1 Tax=Aliiglaciecola sp. CAU 1673 TaxID=3032595 RepID=UPI0023D9E5AA|nr:hypothetical protein [Aliiglaciecola sp. CAU 1673]MDF2177909.1 hypothetical protein [Aliiglaciecola sp. CAU 1673]
MQNSILEKLKENTQVIYRKALDADQTLGRLHQAGQGKFVQIFPQDAGFSVTSKRFQPYVEELAKDIAELESLNEQGPFETKLAVVVQKMEQLFSTLSRFKESLRE